MPRQPRIDWFRVITDLERNGRPWTAITALLGRSDGWLAHLKNSPGASPRHDDGEALLSLWCDACDKPLDSVPRVGPGVYG